MSASSKTMTGALPPSSRWTRFRSAAAAAATSMPARTLPVIETIAGIGCGDQGPAGVAVAADDVEDAGRQVLGRGSRPAAASGRRRVRWLQHHRVASGQRRRPLPDGHHHRVVPRRHRGADADRLAPDVRGVARHVLAAARPSSSRAAPAKKRIWSTIGGISSAIVSGERLAGVLATRSATSSSARASIASAIRSRARLRSDGVVRCHDGERVGRDRGRPGRRRPAPETGASANGSPVLGSMTGAVSPSSASTCSTTDEVPQAIPVTAAQRSQRIVASTSDNVQERRPMTPKFRLTPATSYDGFDMGTPAHDGRRLDGHRPGVPTRRMPANTRIASSETDRPTDADDVAGGTMPGRACRPGCSTRPTGRSSRRSSATDDGPTRRSPTRSGCPRRRSAAGSSGCARPGSCRSSR